jgi:hypothetical protein
MSVILATKEVEVRKIAVEKLPRQNTSKKTGLAEWLKRWRTFLASLTSVRL